MDKINVLIRGLALGMLVAVTIPPSAQGQSCPEPLSPSQQAELYRVAPHVAQDMIKKDFEIANLCMRTQSAALELEGRKYDYAMQFLNLATDEPTYQSWRAFAATMLKSKDMAIIPLYYSPKWVADVIANIDASRKLRTK